MPRSSRSRKHGQRGDRQTRKQKWIKDNFNPKLESQSGVAIAEAQQPKVRQPKAPRKTAQERRR